MCSSCELLGCSCMYRSHSAATPHVPLSHTGTHDARAEVAAALPIQHAPTQKSSRDVGVLEEPHDKATNNGHIPRGPTTAKDSNLGLGVCMLAPESDAGTD